MSDQNDVCLEITVKFCCNLRDIFSIYTVACNLRYKCRNSVSAGAYAIDFLLGFRSILRSICLGTHIYPSADVFITGILSARMHFRGVMLCIWNDPAITEIRPILDMSHCNRILHKVLLAVNVEHRETYFDEIKTHLIPVIKYTTGQIYGYFGNQLLSHIELSCLQSKLRLW